MNRCTVIIFNIMFNWKYNTLISCLMLHFAPYSNMQLMMVVPVPMVVVFLCCFYWICACWINTFEFTINIYTEVEVLCNLLLILSAKVLHINLLVRMHGICNLVEPHRTRHLLLQCCFHSIPKCLMPKIYRQWQFIFH